MLAVFTVVVTTYFVTYNVSQWAMAGVGGRFLWRYQRRRNPRNLALVARLAAPPFVSIVVPAHNESLTIVNSIRALLALEYEAREIVVVNDGSKDDTLAVLKQSFELVEAPVAFEQPLKSAPLRGVYRSLVEPALVVIDKVNGGSKSDAVNAGINAASGAAGAGDRRRHHARARCAVTRRDAVPGRPGHGSSRWIRGDCERVPDREQPRHRCRHAAELAGALPDRRVPCGASCSSGWRAHLGTAWR